ncbi:DUF3237 family protein [Brevibacterium aurantiacum]|uniref:UPF0311 protein BLSMQ_1393 n=1 Tax=Brevibacterium aurantiacum TaxID=273384 RepID=A0A1D7W264_BREAU|nr:DUF3237 family protein [Brevibacterium aurantiacum]AOP53103.1 hypothetical protein BLSMQ_1393 [Brevibacterium aurantiacum]RCS99267.1 DUF3237 family protein [Brevibacterium aurantiacum]
MNAVPGKPTGTPPNEITPPELAYLATIDVEVEAPIMIGNTVDGLRKIVPIRGGRVTGPELNGTVLDAGADFQQYPIDTVAYLAADYVLKTDDGHHVLVENRALRTGSTSDLNKLMNGEHVDPERIYFRCVPRLSADRSGPYAWMSEVLFIGSGVRSPNGVRIEISQVL